MIRRKAVEGRFWAKVKIGDSSECWLWTGAKFRKGYGMFVIVRGHPTGAHRYSWSLANGPIPEGMWILHHCDNPPCVNPAHLFLGTRADNIRDYASKGFRFGATDPENVRGENNGRAKLTEDQVREIRRRYATGAETQTALGAAFGLSHIQIGSVVRRKAWRHVS